MFIGRYCNVLVDKQEHDSTTPENEFVVCEYVKMPWYLQHIRPCFRHINVVTFLPVTGNWLLNTSNWRQGYYVLGY